MLAIGGSISIVVLSEREDTQETMLLINKLDSSKNENVRLQAQVIENQKSQIDTLNQIKSLSIRLADAQESNYLLQKELFKNITGNRNYPILSITANKSRAFRGMFTEETVEFYIIKFNLINSGRYPLNSIKVDFSDHYGFYIGQYVTVTKNGFSQAPDPRFSIRQPFLDKSIQIGSIPANSIDREFYRTTIPLFSRATYVVTVNWTGGSIEYWIRLDNVDKEYMPITYEQVYTESNIDISKKRLQKVLQKEFPSEEITIKRVISRYENSHYQ